MTKLGSGFGSFRVSPSHRRGLPGHRINCVSIPAGVRLLTYTEFVLVLHNPSAGKFRKLLVIFQKMCGAGENG